MTPGIVFDIREFTIHDGPGIRTTVFMKGCPLSCTWCHNPEGQSKRPQIISSAGRERVAGQVYTANELAALLRRQADILQANEGGLTFSGGEPLLQADFVADVIDLLPRMHMLLDTSGFGAEQDFRRLVDRCDLIFYDLKLVDAAAHRRYTKQDNAIILGNLEVLSTSGKPFVVRVPLVPGVTDTDENLFAIARAVCELPGMLHVELLPYNRAAGSKYQSAGMQFKPGYDETQPVNVNITFFEQAGVKVLVR
jgi:pyruvate formate lyase activating enzyme